MRSPSKDLPYKNISNMFLKVDLKTSWNTFEVYTSNLNFFHSILKKFFLVPSSALFGLISQMFLAYHVLHPFKHVNVEKCLLCKHSGERMTCIAETVYFLLRRRVQWIFHEQYDIWIIIWVHYLYICVLLLINL